MKTVLDFGPYFGVAREKGRFGKRKGSKRVQKNRERGQKTRLLHHQREKGLILFFFHSRIYINKHVRTMLLLSRFLTRT